jgi:hypothetical protein
MSAGTVCTPEDLLCLPDDGRTYELIAGRLTEKRAGAYSCWVAGSVHHLLLLFGEDRGFGWAMPSGAGYSL